YENTYSKIGHGGFNEWSQNGGAYWNGEHYFRDGAETIIASNFDHTTGIATTTYTSSNGGVDGVFGWDFGGPVSANISVTAGGDLVMDHMAPGERDVWNTLLFDNGEDIPTHGAFTQIGHGGRDIDAIRRQSAAYDYDDKIGDIAVTVGGNLDMRNGAEHEHWTAIG
ncbi:MAG: hypothetical protein KDM91_22450, partial [Verrucomicrobiae bacterium]|nr:hypothetical protein [Verrucomicrobiae bacterium]